MKFSIIVPMYNVEKYIDKCISSLLCQDLDDYEIILINDGSSDLTKEHCRPYLEHDNIFYYEQENKGQSFARNRGLEIARGEYIFFVDADDFLCENVLKMLYNYLNESKVEVLTFNYRHFSSDYVFMDNQNPLHIKPKEIWSGVDYIEKYGFDIHVVAWLYVYKKDFLINNNIKFAEGLYHEDCEWTAQWFPLVSRFGYIDVSVYNQVISAVSTMRSKNLKKSFDLIMISELIHNNADKIYSISKVCSKKIHEYASFEAWSAVHSCCSMGFRLVDLISNKETRMKVLYLMRDNKRYVIIRLLLRIRLYKAIENIVHIYDSIKLKDVKGGYK